MSRKSFIPLLLLVLLSVLSWGCKLTSRALDVFSSVSPGVPCGFCVQMSVPRSPARHSALLCLLGPSCSELSLVWCEDYSLWLIALLSLPGPLLSLSSSCRCFSVIQQKTGFCFEIESQCLFLIDVNLAHSLIWHVFGISSVAAALVSLEGFF